MPALNLPENQLGNVEQVQDAHDPTGVINKPKKGAEADEKLLATVNSWWIEARDAHAPNRAEQHIDADFYDHHQITPDHAAALDQRGQAPLQYNLVKVACDWIIGTERRTRIDWKVHPRGPEDARPALAKQHVMKYVDDANDGSFARSHAFTHAIKVGIGWTEECYDPDADGEPLVIRHQDWKGMWWDPFAQKLDLSDARYMIRVKWLDVDFAIQKWPQHTNAIERYARATDEIDLEDVEDPADVPGMFFNRTTHTHTIGVYGASASGQRRLRSRVRVLECWYKAPVRKKRMVGWSESLDRKLFDPANPSHAAAVANGTVDLVDAVVFEIRKVIWLPSLILEQGVEPYRHGRYPFTPIIAFRDDKTGLPYGYIRGMRDAQDDYNKRRAKALFLLSVNRFVYERGALDEDDEEEIRAEAAAPDAQIRVAPGALQNNRVRWETGQSLAHDQIALMEQSKMHILEGNGITRENLGQSSNTISGRAILAKQQQGSVSSAEVFDNYRFSFRQSGRKTLSNIEQFMSMPKRLRILGPTGANDWLMVNEPVFDPITREVFFENDLTASEADFHVDQQDYRETVRMAMAEALFDVIRNLPPDLQLGLLDLALELTDLPNRDEIVRRIRQLNGQSAPGEQDSPDAVAKRDAAAAAQARDQALTEAERTAKIRRDEAAALRDEQTARKTMVDTKASAMNTAGLVAAALPLAPAADRLAEFPAEPGVQS